MGKKVNHVHVVPWKGEGVKWAVKLPKEKTPLFTSRLKKDAVVEGRRLAKEREAELLIHKRDGTIQAKHSFGNDPRGNG